MFLKMKRDNDNALYDDIYYLCHPSEVEVRDHSLHDCIINTIAYQIDNES